MGGSSSTRRITVVNDESSGVIKISDSVVYRLREEWKETQSETKRKTAEPPKPVKPSPTTPAEPQGVAAAESAPSKEIKPAPAAVAKVDILPRPTEKLEDKRRGESATSHNYWREKYKDLEQQNAEVNKETVREFNKALQEVEMLFTDTTCSTACEAHEAKVVKCYQENPRTTLNCSQEVKAFADCVGAMRLKATTLLKG